MNEEDKPSGDMNKTENKANDSSGKKAHMTMMIVVLVLVAGLVGLGVLYFNATSEVDDQKQSIAQLQKMVDGAKEADTYAHEESEIAEEEGGSGESGSGSGSGAACTGGSAYSASVGKFDLDLTSPNVIVRNLDGGFEGGPITSMSVGQCATSGTNVTDLTPSGEITILAHPASTSSDLKTSYEAQNSITMTAGSTVMIDGVSAQIYTNSGLFEQKFLYFDNNSIGYQIELMDDNTVTNAVLTDITSDWSFTP